MHGYKWPINCTRTSTRGVRSHWHRRRRTHRIDETIITYIITVGSYRHHDPCVCARERACTATMAETATEVLDQPVFLVLSMQTGQGGRMAPAAAVVLAHTSGQSATVYICCSDMSDEGVKSILTPTKNTQHTNKM